MNFSNFIKIIKSRLFFLIFLIPYLLLVFVTYKDFGVAIDEPIEYRFGELLYNRYFGNDPILIENFSIEKSDSREIWAYNHFHTMLMYIVNDSGSIEIYHLLNLLFACIAFYSIFEMVYQRTNKPILSLIGPFFLFMLPRFTGDLASNVKDPVYASWLVFSILLLMITRKIPRLWIRGTIIGIGIGLMSASRFLGYSLIPIYGAYSLWQILTCSKTKIINIIRLFIELTVVAVSAIVIHSIQMPFVAADPIKNLVRLSEVARSYPWEGTMLFNGESIVSGNLPWNYLIIWFSITTPIYLIVLWLISHLFIKRKTFQLLHFIFWGNVLIYYLIKPIIYDGIRHMLFLEVLASILAALTWVTIWQEHKKMRKILACTLIIFGIFVSKEYFNLHPYQYTYFNQSVGGLHGAFNKFETDYWGLSYKEGAKWLIAQNESSAIVGICGNWESNIYFAQTNYITKWIPRCEFVPLDVEYVLANGRDGDWSKIEGETLYAVERENIPLMKVIKLD